MSSDIFYSSFNSSNSNQNIKLVPAFADKKNISINTPSISYTVDVVDNTRKKINFFLSKTRNMQLQSNMSTKINTKAISKNQSKVYINLNKFRKRYLGVTQV